MYVFSNSYFSKKRSKLFYLISKLFNKNWYKIKSKNF
jgi:hypothetical protein